MQCIEIEVKAMANFKSSSLDPRECMYRLGNNIRKRISKAIDSNEQQLETLTDSDTNALNCLKKAIESEEENKQLVNYETLSQIHKYLQRIDEKYNYYFYQLLDECRVVLPQTRKNEELESRIKTLKCKAANDEYFTMTNTVSRNNRNSSSAANFNIQSSIGSEFRQMRSTMIAMINALLAIGGTFLFCYKAVEYALPEPHISAQVLIGLIAALVVAIAEFYFLIRII